MTVDTSPAPSFRQRLALHGEDWLLLAGLAAVFGFALAGAFAHMHDWTITATNEALRAYADRRGLAEAPTVDDWLGWANAVTSEIMPTASLLYIRKRQRQGRKIGGPVALYVGSMIVSLLGQLSSIGVRVPGDAVLVACLPIIALTVLSILKFADMSYAREAAIEAEQRAEQQRRADARRAEQQRREADERAEQQRAAAELAAERAAELERQRERDTAELAARLAREQREHEAELERQRIAAEQAGITERARIEADERARQREADERREAAERAAEQRRLDEAARIAAEADAEARRLAAAAEARRIEAEAQRIEAEAEARRVAAERLAAAQREADHERADDTTGRAPRRPAAETAALVDAVLVGLDNGTDRAAAVKAVADQLNVTVEYARRFVPAGYVKGSSAPVDAGSSAATVDEAPASSGGRRHLAVVGAG